MRPFLRLSAAVSAVLLASGSASAQQGPCVGREGPVRLNVTVEGVRSAEGLVAITLYADDPDRFLVRRGSIYTGRTPAQAPVTSTCIYLPSTGVYALGVYHDEDGDRGLDRSALGIPTEGVGFSNNPRLVLSIPSFRSVRLAVPRDNMRTTIRLRYP